MSGTRNVVGQKWCRRHIVYIDLPSDPHFAGWTRIWTLKPADPRKPSKNPHFDFQGLMNFFHA